MTTIQAINDVKAKAIESACASTADLAFSEKTVVGIVVRGSKAITGKFGPNEGKQIQKAQTYRIVKVLGNKKSASAEMQSGGRIEASSTKVDWYLVSTLDEIETRSRQLLGDELYDLCATNLSATNPNRDRWQEMLLRLADWLDAAAAESATELSEEEIRRLTSDAKLHRRLATNK